jgi:apolipoprotein N-acyltransferase
MKITQEGLKKTSAAFFSSILLILAFPSAFSKAGFSILAWFALIPLFYCLEGRSPAKRLFFSYLAGMIFYSGLLYWLFQVSVPGALVLVLLLSISFGLFGLFFIRPVNDKLTYLVYIPALWVAVEFLRTYLFTGFPWSLLGYSQQVNLHFIQIADLTGSYGVSFLIVLVNCIAYRVIIKRDRGSFGLAAAGFFILAVVMFYGKYNLERPLSTHDLNVAVVQGNIPQHLKWDRRLDKYILNRYEMLSCEAAEQQADIIIWPETAIPGALESEEFFSESIEELAKTLNRALLIGTVKLDDEVMYNAATVVSRDGTIENSYYKTHLVPFGEYIPLEKHVPLLRNYIDKPIGDFESGEDYEIFRFSFTRYLDDPGEGNNIKKTTLFYNFAALVCFEDIFPALARNAVKKGAEFIAVITNDAWFGDTAAAYQHNQASVFRAVENRVPCVRAANTGISSIIDQKGQILAQVSAMGEETFIDGVAVGKIRPVYWRSFYSRYGDIFAWFCVVLFISGVIFSKKNNAKKA